ncbi:hypothetical protein BKA62DRAFT_703888 [Auriculariales sp. MPI-PUGE-AT-0066]|nr:hypothetical protein BKA62DRAFT_703888 [Auriculariales sp. MPI-PUGE-AT-0066]
MRTRLNDSDSTSSEESSITFASVCRLREEFADIVRRTPVRLLGAVFGDGMGQQGSCGPVLDIVKDTLKTWSGRNSSIVGRSVEAIVAGKTQYLAVVQGMPKPIEEEFKETPSNVWERDGESRKALVNHEHMALLPT